MENENSVICVKNINRTYKVYKRNGGMFKFLFSRDFEEIEAVKNVSFTLKRGDVVGFIGPNGAGKSTTIKMLCGILLPSSGSIQVLGKDPFNFRKINSYRIGTVFGQRTQLWWDLPVSDTMNLIKKIYNISDDDFAKNIDFYNQYLSIIDIWHQPVRQLSLGQRMKAEIASSILYNPEILFLDEPTIGLDVLAKKQIRNFITQLNKKYNTTVIITSHDMGDIEELCERVIIIDRGTVMYDGSLPGITAKYSDEVSVSFSFTQPFDGANQIVDCLSIIHSDDRLNYNFTFLKSQKSVDDLIREIYQILDGKDIEIENIKINEKSVEDIIRGLYDSKSY